MSGLVGHRENQLEYTRIVALWRVTQITTLQGRSSDCSSAGAQYSRLADMSTMLVSAGLGSGRDPVKCLRAGQKAWFTIAGDPQTRYEGVFKRYSADAGKINDAIFYYARFEVPNPKKNLAS